MHKNNMWTAFFYAFIIVLLVVIGVEAIMIFDQEARLNALQKKTREMSQRVDATLWRADIVLKAHEQQLFGTCTATSTE